MIFKRPYSGGLFHGERKHFYADSPQNRFLLKIAPFSLDNDIKIMYNNIIYKYVKKVKGKI